MRNRILAIICLLQFAVLIILSVLWGQQTQQPIGYRPSFYSPTNQEPTFFGRPGPWGEIEYTRINIEPPDEFVNVNDNFEPTRWFFDNFTVEKLDAFFKSSGLTAQQTDKLLNPIAITMETNGIFVSPGDDLILSMAPGTRAQIYSELSRNERNEFQSAPYTYRNGGFDDWLGGSKLSPQTLEMLKQLVYRRGNSICFSDMPQLFRQISSTDERRRLVKALSRNSTLLMKLRVRPDSSVANLSDYWDIGGRAKDIVPLLDSLTKVPRSATVDIVHLLPPFARKRINTYPLRETDFNKTPNCFWTVMNFFNDVPDDRYYDNSIWLEELKTNYSLVDKPTFGDLIFLARPDNFPIHAAVYIADDVVFTKNGANECQPWVLMKMEDMLARYPKDYVLKMVCFRRLTSKHG